MYSHKCHEPSAPCGPFGVPALRRVRRRIRASGCCGGDVGSPMRPTWTRDGLVARLRSSESLQYRRYARTHTYACARSASARVSTLRAHVNASYDARVCVCSRCIRVHQLWLTRAHSERSDAPHARSGSDLVYRIAESRRRNDGRDIVPIVTRHSRVFSLTNARFRVTRFYTTRVKDLDLGDKEYS